MLLNISNVSKGFGADQILSNVNLRIDSHDKIALVGPNGAGKTTILKILTKEITPDQGSVHWRPSLRVGYLSQHSQLNPKRTVFEEAQEAHKHLLDLKNRLTQLEKKLEVDYTPEDLDEYSLLCEHFQTAGGYSIEQDLLTVLKRMGFDESSFNKPVKGLSGGEQTRLMLAKLILEEPDLLVLDEPTNHLDIEGTEWLERWLKDYGGSVLVVSHDRIFLQNVIDRVVELREGSTKSYPGPFDHYMELRRQEDVRQSELAKQQQEEIDKLDEYVRRFMNSQRTAQARGRLKKMEKLVAQKVEAPSEQKGMQAGFAQAKRGGDIVLECQHLSMQFGDQKLFQDLNWTVRWGERWGIVGVNGMGKSTLLKIITGDIEPVSGKYRLGSQLEVGYFSQDAYEIDLDLSPLEWISDECDLNPQQARDVLGKFLIQGDDVFRPIRSLSGGERNKLVLAKLTILQPNLLILDEPTNHLDLLSREVLIDVLKKYTGTLIVVSHDRSLLEEVTLQTLDLRKEGPVQYPGSFKEYREFWLRSQERPTGRVEKAPTGVVTSRPQISPRELSKEIQQLTKIIDETEKKISYHETELGKIEHLLSLADPNQDHVELSRQYAEIQKHIQHTMKEWEEQSASLEELRGLQ